ncbi:hypothetical protein [Moritella sp. Urea-trap-13]|uniref:hypothetical protein n=1 Tax=Moritella sp. Urea-trap-13 TaxID=2058327 RepID=UPI000C329C28|nr:hypothetical protein [Moritella sp. Urea-trap-13]PKH06684.1 hypothetical protein CXF93_12365 [Moritella sp. Urea-trap-13]
MKRILAPVEDVRLALHSLGINEDKADWIIDLFECVDAGRNDALAMPSFHFNLYATLKQEEVLITVFAFWQSVVTCSETNSTEEQIALGAIRSVYFMAQGFALTKLVACIELWWEQTLEIHNTTIWMVA